MDHRQTAAEAGVVASDQVFPDRRVGAVWEPVRARCYAAAGAYLSFTDELDTAEATGSPIADGPARADALVRQLNDAARGVDEFYHSHRAGLEDAARVRSAVPQLLTHVRSEAEQVLAAAASSGYANYPSIEAGVRRLNEDLITASSVDPQTSVAAARTAAAAVQQATSELSDALAQAPSRASAAAKAIASVTTRLAAVRNRASGLGPAYSALLREFNAASSADLTNNERESRRGIDAADAALVGARVAAADHDPETALDLTATARQHLAEAEQLVDAVTRRLELLREVRADPDAHARTVRFRLRDAQMLAVDRGLVGEWGSVLDAQAERLDRINSGLTGRHPDYWAYVSELDTVAAFIAGVVERMRKHVGTDRT
ncbi:hypothetical protein [Nocardia rhizosphaerihabitans]|uniref:Uncharacterized protein n=1 Tax=Nocardia rhizosphaerihabitans TaxID=1691570 RepID=A0ABQ2KNI6_9NOCA|nr:hypothetical protein [Nocardia rhizosphaerihabitans]GGN87685.1 hypothetical protein GCM10011610_44230 [Nocardia rhizosphaerihabitans]